ncbi:MAG: LysR family transcriptional regulator [Acidobacteriaceae bacterium]|nr:LysR family transcriptional regulator [Acidobacteriaceae bacterium]
MNLNLRHLEAFAAVAKLGSFTKAARSLHVSQPAFTVQIKQLEEELGVRLLDRNTRSVHLTRIGKELAPVVERLLREIESVVADTQALSAKSTGAVTIAALPSVSATLLPPVISQFHRQYSGITFRLREGAEKRILMLVKSEEADFGIGCVDEADPEIHFEPLFTDWMSAVCAADSKLSRKKSVELKDLVSHPLILTDRESSVRRLVDRAFTSMGYPVTPAQEVTYMATALGMVKAGLGVAILPSSALELKELRSLKARPIHHEQLHRTVGVIQKAHHSLSPASGSFLQELRQACQDRQWTSASL